ncbi:MAG: septum formation initiator family protein [Candidatus Omnitrophica bacterium]|nr:septum formation initiator family protein [Candidatus Omnitrophota bacterium]
MIKNAIFVFFVCVLVFIFYLPAYLRMQDLNEKNRSYHKKIVNLERENKLLTWERERLTNDPAYFEKMARERMGIIKEGEVIYKVVPLGSKKRGEAVSEEEAALMKKPESDKKKVAPVKQVKPVKAGKVAVVKKPVVKPVKKSLQQKKKTSAIMSKPKTAKTSNKASSTESNTNLESVQKSSSKD